MIGSHLRTSFSYNFFLAATQTFKGKVFFIQQVLSVLKHHDGGTGHGVVR